MSRQLSAQLETFVEGRLLDDHFTIYCKLSNGGKALVRASQICIGHKNDLGIEVCRHQGHAALAPGRARIGHDPPRQPARPRLLARRGHPGRRFPAQGCAGRPHGRADHSRRATRKRSTMPTPACIAASKPTCASGKPAKPFNCDGSKYANVEDGWMGIAFIETCVKSSAKKGAWTKMPKKI